MSRLDELAIHVDVSVDCTALDKALSDLIAADPAQIQAELLAADEVAAEELGAVLGWRA